MCMNLAFRYPTIELAVSMKPNWKLLGGYQRWQGTVPNSQEIQESWLFFTTVILHAEEAHDNVDHWNTNLPHQYSTLPLPEPVH